MLSILRPALQNLRVSPAARRLMCYYAAQATGFHPSMQIIDAATHIGVKNISKHRRHLVDKGFIGFDGNTILIDWVRIRAFAAINTEQMGKPSSWNISQIEPNCYESVKSEVHNYIGTGDFESRRLYALYEATRQAIEDGVKFPELEGTSGSNCYEIVKSEVHNYIGTSDFTPSQQGLHESVGWYNPFDEPDPPWVYQDGSINAYQEVAP